MDFICNFLCSFPIKSGSKEEKIIEIEIGFLLNENGKLILGVKAPKLFKDAIKNLLDFWK